jgi:starch-binding outer membrane protein, SusD/RagB family
MNFKSMKYLPVALLLFAGACGDDFLSESPQGNSNEEILASTLKGSDALLIAAYSSIDGYSGWDNGNPWGAAASNWVYGSIAGGDAYKGSEANDQPDINPIETHTADANNPYFESKWRTLYDGIARCNTAIRAFTALQGIDDALRAQRLAEARFLRGYYHFEAKRVFGNVPYIDETVIDFRVPNDREIYPQIEADLVAAKAVLPLTQSQIGRATKGACGALLGKVLIYQGKYPAALTEFNEVINSGVYSLAPAYHDNFNAVTRNNSEGVLVVQQAVNEGTEGDNGNIGDVLNYTHGGGPGGCCGFHQPSQNLVNAFRVDANGLPLLDTYNDTDVANDDGINAAAPFTPTTVALDPRLDWTVGRRGIPYLDWGVHPGSAWIRLQAYGGPYSPKKMVYYRGQEGTLTSASGWTKGYTTNNVKLIRYADVLLMAAECEVEGGNLERARALVNQIRERAANPTTWVKDAAGANAANYQIGLYTAAWTDQAVARKAVRFERRIELGMEGHRFFDLVRWGIAAQEKNNVFFPGDRDNRAHLNGAAFTAGKNEIYPIPFRAITLSSKDGVATLKQNPGY